MIHAGPVAVRRFLRRERDEWMVYRRTYDGAFRLVGHRTFEALLASPDVEVVRLANTESGSRSPEAVPMVWGDECVDFERTQPILTNATAMTHLRSLGGIPAVFTMVSDLLDVILEIIIPRDDGDRIDAVLAMLDDLEKSAHPFTGRHLRPNHWDPNPLPRPTSDRHAIFMPPSVFEAMEEAFLFLTDPDAVPGALHNRTVLLAGPPGVGKTLLCRWISGVVDATILWYGPEEIFEPGVPFLLELARSLAPVLMIFEDLDDDPESTDEDSSLHDLLKAIDRNRPLDGIGILATTNDPERFDRLLAGGTAPTRFDRIIRISAPGAGLRHDLIAHLLTTSEVLPAPKPGTVERIHGATEGFTGARIARIVRDIELRWLDAIDHGEIPDLNTILHQLLHERPAVLGTSGFGSGEVE